MPYARIYLTHEKKQQDVDVQEIKDFWNIYSSGGDPTKKAFRVKIDGKYVNCQVLRMAETMEILAREVSSKRSHVPKLNASLFEDTIDQMDVKQNKKKHTAKKASEVARRTSAKTDTVGEILDAYMKEQPHPTPLKGNIRTPRNKTTKGVDYCEDTLCESSSNSCTEQRTSGCSDDSALDKGTDKHSTSSAEEMSNHEIDQYLEEYDAHTQWKKMYIELRDSKQFPLTEATGQQILEILKGGKGLAAPLCTLENNPKIPRVMDPEMIDLGGGLKIRQSIRETIWKCDEPGRFISSLAQYVWGVETLAKRCVRAQANVKEPQLEDDKKGIVLKHFKLWLKDLEYPTLHREMNKINKYLNSAITAARKKLKRTSNAGNKCTEDEKENQVESDVEQKSSKSKKRAFLLEPKKKTCCV